MKQSHPAATNAGVDSTTRTRAVDGGLGLRAASVLGAEVPA